MVLLWSCPYTNSEGKALRKWFSWQFQLLDPDLWYEPFPVKLLFYVLMGKFSNLDNFIHFLCGWFKVKNSGGEYISRKLLWTLDSKWHRRSFYLELNLLIQTTDEATAGLPFLVWGLQVCILAWVSQQRGSLIKLWGFCSAFPITSTTVSSQRVQKYFAESSSCKSEMVRLMDLCNLWTFIE